MKESSIFLDAKKMHKMLKSYWAKLTGQAVPNEDDDDEAPPTKKQKKDKNGATLKSYLNGRLKKLLAMKDSQFVCSRSTVLLS